MRILFGHQNFTRQRYGGVARYVVELARHIAATKGNLVEIFSPLYLTEYALAIDGIQHRGYKIPYFLGSGRIALGINTLCAKLTTTDHADVDIYHDTYFSSFDCAPRNAKRIVTVHDMIHEKYPDNFPRWDRTSNNKVRAVTRADHIICVSVNTQKDLIDLLNVPFEKTSVVYQGASLSEELIRNPPSSHKPYILYVGQRGGYKNFNRFLSALAGSSVLRENFSLICFGGGSLTRHEHELINSLRFPQDFVSQISGGDDVLVGLYSEAHALIYPSLYEGFGIPPLEAMSFGCPVVCSNTSSLPEVVGDAAELFDPCDEFEIRTVIERVVSSPEYSAKLAAKGRERVKQFSWQKCAKDTLNVYQKTIA